MSEVKPCPFIEVLQTVHDYLLESVKPWDSAHQTIYNLIEPILKNVDGNCVNSRSSWVSVEELKKLVNNYRSRLPRGRPPLTYKGGFDAGYNLGRAHAYEEIAAIMNKSAPPSITTLKDAMEGRR
jgi:hypothetical protein